ncbi:oligosaccharide flippase family protein [uncultured Methanolobus sp.]|uniref:lipopolysaccharide biosynthesis protein n=1 Tax=uncultured Methanolobus sp. TaxID=218300 RepID=UPI0029C7CCFF|nr:oligosaccharide flippase family protein [uncultured Methanolobus sp.]
MANFASNVFKLVSASLTAQIIGLLLVPIITRLYTPDDFGVFQLIISIASIVGVVSCFSYHTAIMLPKDDSEAQDLLVLCFILLFFVVSLFSLITIIFSKNIIIYLNAPYIIPYLPYLSLFILVDGIFSIYNYWLTRKEEFGTLGSSRVLRALTTKGLQIILGTVLFSPAGLILGYIAGYTVSDFIMVRKSPSLLSLLSKVSPSSLKKVAIRYKKFPIYSTGSAFATNLSIQVPSLMLALFYDTTVVGLYSLSYTVVNVPSNMIGQSLGQAFFQKAMHDKNNKGSVKYISYKVYATLVSLGLFPMLLLMVMSKDLFNFAFGSEWVDAGTYTMILIPWLFLVFISSPLSSLFSVLEKQDVGFKFQIALMVSRIISLFVGGSFGGPLFALSLFSLTGIIFWSWMNYYLLKSAGITIKETKHVFFKNLRQSIILIVPILLGKFLMVNFIILVCLVMLVTVIYYIPVIKDEFDLDIIDYLKKYYYIYVKF